MKICLISMPFASILRPSVGLGLLQAHVQNFGHCCDVLNINIEYAHLIGEENYEYCGAYDPTDLIGEWVFSQIYFNERKSDELLINNIINKERAVTIKWRTPQRLKKLINSSYVAAVKLIDRYRDYDWEQYDVIGFSSNFQQNMASLSMAKVIKQASKNVKIIFGGANCFEKMGDGLLELFPEIDAVCPGEGENALIEYLDSVEKGKSDNVEGMITRKCTLYKSTQIDLNILTEPNYDEYYKNMDDLFPEAISKLWLPIESARGCWWGEKHQCRFCGLNGEQLKYRNKKDKIILSEIDELSRKYGTRKIMFIDNIMSMNYISTLLPKLINENNRYELFFEVKSNLTQKQIHIMKKAGVKYIQPGIESLSTNSLKLMSKGSTALINVRLLKYCKEYDIVPYWNIIYNFPGETKEDVYNQISLMRKIHHLYPPLSLSRFRLDRFSPIYKKYEIDAEKDLVHEDNYALVYRGFDKAAINRIAYYFKYSIDNIENEEAIEKWTIEFNKWKEMHEKTDLFLVGGKVVSQCDDCVSTYNLSDIELNIIQKTQDIVNTSQMIDSLEIDFIRGEVEQCFIQLVDKGWIIEDDKKCINVILRVNPYVPRMIKQKK
jgi:ribosomal peptide maturation radical SAM protein 1